MNSVKNAGTASLEFMQLTTQITKKEVHVHSIFAGTIAVYFTENNNVALRNLTSNNEFSSLNPFFGYIHTSTMNFYHDYFNK